MTVNSNRIKEFYSPMRYNKLFLFLLFSLFSNWLIANELETKKPLDPGSAFFEQFNNNEDFDYDRELNAKPNIIENLATAISRWFGETLGFQNITSEIIRNSILYFFIFSAILLVAIVIRQLVKTDYSKVASGKQVTPSNTQLNQEEIQDIDFDRIINEAVQRKQYRLALRYLYLSALNDLNEKGLIQWEKDKTNKAYVREMSAQTVSESFNWLTRNFEYYWYGEFPLENKRYEMIAERFSNFRNKIR